MSKIREMGRRIGREFLPEKVLLFGSHARGEAGPDSDIDLLVIMRCKGKSIEKAVEIRLSLDHAHPFDILVRKPGEVRKRLAMGDSIMRDILKEGIVLYEKDRR